MKDRQPESSGPQPRIPIVSNLLHWLAMPAIVYLRGQFGFSYLRSKLVFLSFGWAACLYFIYAWVEKAVWAKWWAVASFFAGASLLYAYHLIQAFRREIDNQGKHDFDSGTSHILRIPGLKRFQESDKSEALVHLWFEPAMVFLVAMTLRLIGERSLSGWLVWVAAALWMKEFINFWYVLRSDKKHEDIIEDAEEKMPGVSGPANVPLPSATGRKARVKRAPATSPIEVDPGTELRHAEVLRLMPPYTLKQAEANYRALSKITHPDTAPPSTENTGRMAELNAAIEYFRQFQER